MRQTPFLHRRRLLQVSATTLGACALAGPSLLGARTLRRPTAPPTPVSPVLAAARAGLQRAGARVTHPDVVAVADFSQPSSHPRFHLVDTASGRVTGLLVAHGRGSDPAHTGWLSRFSNAPGSDCTSQGDFLTAADYIGEHGRSMRLIGLDPTNDNAEARGIVVHSAPYVSSQMIAAHGVLGRSEGCFALSADDLPRVLQRLGPGRLLVSAKL
ncbi:MAG TPA: murein L,D-transpeptidase catalytic domain family protein [Caulobacteraceae bacterium]|jgi:hypothetical protein